MKRIIALILVLCMTAGMIVSVSADSPFAKKLNLVRLIRTMFASDEDAPEFGEIKDGKLTIYVATNGKKDADGTKKNPFSTITAARDAIRTLDKSEFDGIDVAVAKGAYSISESIVFTEEDSGTADCPIRYIGEDGATIVGGVSFTADDFSPATGKDAKYFPEADKVVQIDLGQFGYTPEDIKAYLSNSSYLRVVPFLSADAKRQTLCRYPNDEWINIDGATMIDYNGNETHYTDNDPVDVQYQPDVVVIDYGDEHIETVNSWTSEGNKYIAGHLRFLWCHDQTNILSIDKENGLVTVDYVGSYDPIPGMVIYFYNMPEELDAPGEYFIGDDAILYYYPGENFETAIFSIPVVSTIIDMQDADYITLERLTLTSAEDDAIVMSGADYITIKDCTISSVKDQGITGNGIYMTIEGNHIFDTGSDAISIDSGDLNNREHYNNQTFIRNNYIHDWSVTKTISYAVNAGGIGVNVTHNTFCNSGSKAINIGDVNGLVEYNYIFNVLQTTEDSGVIGGGGINANMIVRYNYIHDAGPTAILETVKTKNPDHSVIGATGIYYDGRGSYFNTYGNVIANIDGNGVLINGGRQNDITGNLIVNCSQDYIWASEHSFTNRTYGEDGKYRPDLKYPMGAYVHFDEFKALNPEAALLLLEVDENTDLKEKMVKEAPAFNVVKNNWCHYNRANRKNPSHGVSQIYHVEEVFWLYTNPEDFDLPYGEVYTTNSNVSSYTNLRNDVDIKTLITETAAGVIEITWEQFEQIGIDPTQWNLNIELPEKVVYFPKG